MATLKDQMLKAGLVSKQEAKRASHEQRVETKQVGRDERERRAQAEREALARQDAERKAADQRLAAQRQEEERARGAALQAGQHVAAQIQAALRDGRMERWAGNRAYYFVAEGRRIDMLTVSEDAQRKLEAGQAAIVRTGDPVQPYTLLLAGPAKRLREAAPERIAVLWE